MNEQIKLFAEQAGLQPYYDAQAEHIKKFAELIIRECAEVAAKVVVEHEGVEFGLVEVCYQHFGIDVETDSAADCVRETHTCPYLEEIHGDYTTLCDCTPEQQHECARDI